VEDAEGAGANDKGGKVCKLRDAVELILEAGMTEEALEARVACALDAPAGSILRCAAPSAAVAIAGDASLAATGFFFLLCGFDLRTYSPEIEVEGVRCKACVCTRGSVRGGGRTCTDRIPIFRAVEWHPLGHMMLRSDKAGLSASASQAADAQKVKEGAVIFVRDASQVRILKSAHNIAPLY